jgi:hypothetical protein
MKLGVVGGDVAIAQSWSVQELIAALYLRCSEELQERPLDNVIGIKGLGRKMACDIPDGGDDVRGAGRE